MEWGLNEYFEMVPVAETARPPRELVPDGPHVLRIERASEEGQLVRVTLAHDDKRYGWVWCNMYQDRDMGRRLGTELRVALGMTPEQWRTAKLDDIVGRRVEAEIYQQVKGTTTYVNVRTFRAAPDQPATARPVARRTATKKADAASASAPDDDIPF